MSVTFNKIEKRGFQLLPERMHQVRLTLRSVNGKQEELTIIVWLSPLQNAFIDDVVKLRAPEHCETPNQYRAERQRTLIEYWMLPCAGQTELQVKSLKSLYHKLSRYYICKVERL